MRWFLSCLLLASLGLASQAQAETWPCLFNKSSPTSVETLTVKNLSFVPNRDKSFTEYRSKFVHKVLFSGTSGEIDLYSRYDVILTGSGEKQSGVFIYLCRGDYTTLVQLTAVKGVGGVFFSPRFLPLTPMMGAS